LKSGHLLSYLKRFPRLMLPEFLLTRSKERGCIRNQMIARLTISVYCYCIVLI